MCFLMFKQTDTVKLLAFEVRSIQSAKFKSSSCPRKQSSHELWPIYQVLPLSMFGKGEVILDFKNISCVAMISSISNLWDQGTEP